MSVNLLLRIKESIARRYSKIASGNCYCNFCEQKSPFFLPFSGGPKSAPSVVFELDVIGSNIEKYACPKCESNDRERHLKFYFLKLKIDKLVQSSRILHFAPEKNFKKYISSLHPKEYVKADLYPASQDIIKVDMLEMQFTSGHFDIVIANHVLEHVADDTQALLEINRVLKPGGLAILQTPYSAMLNNTFEDSGITSKSARRHAYGQDDHVRLYGKDIFDRFSKAGFKSLVIEHNSVLPEISSNLFGVNTREPFFLFEKI